MVPTLSNKPFCAWPINITVELARSCRSVRRRAPSVRSYWQPLRARVASRERGSQGSIIPAKASCIAYYTYYILLRIIFRIILASCELKLWRFLLGFRRFGQRRRRPRRSRPPAPLSSRRPRRRRPHPHAHRLRADAKKWRETAGRCSPCEHVWDLTHIPTHSSHLVEHVALFVACWYSRTQNT